MTTASKKILAAAAAAALAGCACCKSANADDRSWDWSPLGLSFAAPVQIPFVESDVYGLRFDGLYARNYDVYGIDVGLSAQTDGNFAGIQCAAVNVDWDDVWGLQLGVVDWCGAFAGVQFGALNWDSAASYGWQAGVVNADQEDFTGLAVAAVNFSFRFGGCQIGAVNVADEMEGVQIGAFNAAQRAKGLQIGAVNVIAEGALPVMVVANASF